MGWSVVEGAADTHDALVDHVGVDHGGLGILVSEQFLECWAMELLLAEVGKDMLYSIGWLIFVNPLESS